jgi:5-formyltetrahydrofolate cyclo-ligase
MCQKQARRRLREQGIRKRDDIPPNVRSELSAQIANRVTDWVQTQPINAVMLYLGMRSEVETDRLLNVLFAQGKTVLAPVMDVKRRTLTPHRIIHPERALVRHPYGMREPNPATCPVFPTDQIGLILVPGVAFDPRGYRIGYGLGCYDRFLPTCLQATWIGLAYEAQMIADTLPQAWDVPLHQIFTESREVLGPI